MRILDRLRFGKEPAWEAVRRLPPNGRAELIQAIIEKLPPNAPPQLITDLQRVQNGDVDQARQALAHAERLIDVRAIAVRFQGSRRR